jgi:hypothetical protein
MGLTSAQAIKSKAAITAFVPSTIRSLEYCAALTDGGGNVVEACNDS